jgi:hypothetical protein
MSTEIFRRAIPKRHRLAVSLLSRCSKGNDTLVGNVVKVAAMTNGRLKSTTVRFTDTDLRLIDGLQDKLGLGMIQVIRLAIRRLAEIEKVSSPPTTHQVEVRRHGQVKAKKSRTH